jgi:meiotically up-regulated gene 157 (Mug157) protein
MKITYTIWQGSLLKGTLTAKSMKEIIAIVDELNESKPTLKFQHMVHKIEQVA